MRYNPQPVSIEDGVVKVGDVTVGQHFNGRFNPNRVGKNWEIKPAAGTRAQVIAKIAANRARYWAELAE